MNRIKSSNPISPSHTRFIDRTKNSVRHLGRTISTIVNSKAFHIAMKVSAAALLGVTAFGLATLFAPVGIAAAIGLLVAVGVPVILVVNKVNNEWDKNYQANHKKIEDDGHQYSNQRW